MLLKSKCITILKEKNQEMILKIKEMIKKKKFYPVKIDQEIVCFDGLNSSSL